jgi:peroxiredoxin family protein
VTGYRDGPLTAARLYSSTAVTLDTIGNVYFTEYSTNLVRAISTAGTVTTWAGLNGTVGLIDGAGTTARFYNPYGLVIDSSQNVFVADQGNQAVRKVSSARVVTTIYHQSGSFFNGVALSSSGVLYASEDNTHVISIIATSGTSSRTVFAGTGASGYANGIDTSAAFHTPCQIGFSSVGDLFVADQYNYCVRKISGAGSKTLLETVLNTDAKICLGMVTSFAGGPSLSGFLDGSLSVAKFGWVVGVAVDTSGFVYVSDLSNSAIRMITSSGGLHGCMDGRFVALFLLQPHEIFRTCYYNCGKFSCVVGIRKRAGNGRTVSW